MTAVEPAARRDDAAIVQLVSLHALVVAVPAVLVLGLVGLPILVAFLLALVLAGGLTFWRLRGSDERIARRLGARPIRPGDHPRLASLVANVSMACGVAPPRLLLIESASRNAVVWGAGNGPVSLAVTRGLLEASDRISLEAVLAYELSVAGDGVSVVTIASSLFGPLAKGPLEGPVASLAHATVDERRVVKADLESVRATRYPPGLVAALELLVDEPTTVAGAPPALSPLFLAPPVDTAGPFAVHPPVLDRIDLIREL